MLNTVTIIKWSLLNDLEENLEWARLASSLSSCGDRNGVLLLTAAAMVMMGSMHLIITP